MQGLISVYSQIAMYQKLFFKKSQDKESVNHGSESFSLQLLVHRFPLLSVNESIEGMPQDAIGHTYTDELRVLIRLQTNYRGIVSIIYWYCLLIIYPYLSTIHLGPKKWIEH